MASVDVNAVLAEIMGDTRLLELPDSIDGIIEVLKKHADRYIKITSVRLKNGHKDKVSDDDMTQVAVFLHAMQNLEVFDPTIKTTGKLDQVLKLIFAPIFNYPVEYQLIAKAIYEKFEAKNWSDTTVQAENVSPDDTINGTASGDVTGASISSQSRAESRPFVLSKFPSANHPIYGSNGIMRGILRIKSKRSVSYSLDKRFKSKNGSKFGDNGLLNGQCWPMQVALLRDGGHAAMMAGIAGTASQGAYSIVVSPGRYDSLDKDEGSTLYYSAANAYCAKSKKSQLSDGTRALLKSVTTSRPVRVFRSAKGKWDGAPKAGIRYDGLYVVESCKEETNGNGGAYKVFRLERCGLQQPIQTSEPSDALALEFAKVADGYPRT